jgi:hypothetical protein
MNDFTEHNDDFLKGLFKKTGTDKAPSNFTGKIMEKIQAEAVNETIATSRLITLKTWLFVAVGFAGLIWFLFFSHWSIASLSFSPEKMDARQYQQLLSYFKSTFEGILSFFSFFGTSKIPLIIIVGVISLVLIDRLLRKLVPNRTFLLIGF